MNEESQPERLSGSQDGTLVRALEELIARREAGGAGTAGRPSGATARPAAGACPQADDWLRLLQSDAESAEGVAVLAHVAVCAACVDTVRMLLSDASPEELTAMEEMASGSPAWQKELASQMARTPVHAIRKQERGWYMWAGSALAAMILIAAVLSFWWRYANAPERQLAEAYSHARIFELRMPGAGFAEVMPTRHSRSAGIIHTPAKLLDARAQIESQLKRKPDDAHWLQLEARADVLQENFDPAIEILNRLLASGPPTASLLADDAAAYFERGMATGSEDDRATALGYLRQADVLAPGNAMILFNEAVVMEDQGQSMSAVETWNRYLSFEHDSRWLAEGRRRLAGLEENLKRLNTLGDRGK